MLKNFGRKVYGFLKKSFEEGTSIDKGVILAATFLGPLAHMSLYVMYTYITPTEYESLIFRSFLSVLCVLSSSYFYLSGRIKNFYFPIYWHFMVLMVLPFQCTFLMLKTDFNPLYLYWQIFCTIVMIIYIPNWFMAITDLLIAITLAIVCYLITNSQGELLDNLNNFDLFGYLSIYSFTALSSIAFVYTNRLSWINKQKEQHHRMLALTGSIVHEIRNPLNAIRLSVDSIKENILPDQKENKNIRDSANRISGSIKQANKIIDVILGDLSNKPLEESDFIYLRIGETVSQIVDQYGFSSEEQRKRITFSLDNSLYLKAIPDRLAFVFYNLLKNALFYSKTHADLAIKIGTEVSDNDNYPSDQYNALYFIDNGPGIDPEILPKLFGNFVTSGKKEGTGLGLAFCKRTMKAFKGDIICESEFGKWTKFTLFFPKLRDDEENKIRIIEEITGKSIQNIQVTQDNLNELLERKEQLRVKIDSLNENGKDSIKLEGKDAAIKEVIREELQEIESKTIRTKRVLIADDQEVNLMVTEKIIKSLVPNIEFDRAINGKEALDLATEAFKNNSLYDLIVLDLQMPVMGGIEATKEIRKFDEYTPIISNTSRTSVHIKEEILEIGIDCYIPKPIPNNGIVKTINKWLINDHTYNYDLEDVESNIKGKKVLLADDEEVNLMLMRNFLTKHNLEVDTVSNGRELIDRYKSQFGDKLGNMDQLDERFNPMQQSVLFNKYDIIISDMYMPEINGDDAIKEIRKIETINNIHNKAIIIVNSGDSDSNFLRQILRKGADDYFIKGNNNKRLLQSINFWLLHSHKYKKKGVLNNNLKDSSQKKDVNDFRANPINTDKIYDNVDSHPLLNDKIERDDLLTLRSSFITSVDKLINRIKKADKDNNMNAMAFETHSLKGIAGNIGAERLFVFTTIINTFAKNNKPIDEYNHNWFYIMNQIWDITKDELQRL